MKCLTPVVLFLTAIGNLYPEEPICRLQPPAQADPCAAMEKPATTALKGSQGDQNEEYWFEHMTDYLKDGAAKHRIMLYFRNKHAGKLLPAQWQDAAMPFIRFSGCRYNDFETTKVPEEVKST